MPPAPVPPCRTVARAALLAGALGLALACRSAGPVAAPPPPPPVPTPVPAATPTPAPTPLPKVRRAPEEVVVAAWSEPPRLGEGGGQAHILVRLQKRSGKPFAGVDVQLTTSQGTLYSQGRLLTSNANGMTRDMLTTHHTATVTVNAGGTRYRFKVAVAPDVVER